MLVGKEEAPWGGSFYLCFPGAAVVQCEQRMLSSRDQTILQDALSDL